MQLPRDLIDLFIAAYISLFLFYQSLHATHCQEINYNYKGGKSFFTLLQKTLQAISVLLFR